MGRVQVEQCSFNEADQERTMKLGMLSRAQCDPNAPMRGIIFCTAQKGATLRSLKRGVLTEQVIKPIKRYLQEDLDHFVVIVTPINPRHPDAEDAVVVEEKVKAWPLTPTTYTLHGFFARPLTVSIHVVPEVEKLRIAPTSVLLRKHFRRSRDIDRVFITSDHESDSRKKVIMSARESLPPNYSVEAVKYL